MPARILGVSDRLINSALKEFSEKGFSNASIRVIASDAHTSTRAIYTRFKDKDGLFSAIVEPVYSHIIEMLRENSNSFWDDYNKNKTYDNTGDIYTRIIEYAYNHITEMKIILACPQDNNFGHLTERLCQINSENMHTAIEDTDNIDSVFFHIIMHSFYEGLFEPIRHDMSKEDGIKYVGKLVEFLEKGLDLRDTNI